MVEKEVQVRNDDINSTNYKKRLFHQLTLGEKVSIVHAVLIEMEHHKDVAREYRVPVSLVSRLVFKIKRNKKYLGELMDQYKAKEEKH